MFIIFSLRTCACQNSRKIYGISLRFRFCVHRPKSDDTAWRGTRVPAQSDWVMMVPSLDHRCEGKMHRVNRVNGRRVPCFSVTQNNLSL